LAKYGTATSEFLVKEFHAIGIQKTLKIINCVNKDEFQTTDYDVARRQLKIEKKEKMLLTFGNTFFKERTIYLLRVFEQIYKLDPTIKLYMNFDPKYLIQDNAPEEKFNEAIFKNIVTVGFLNKE